MSPIHKPRRKVVLLAAGATVLIFIGVAAGFVSSLSGAYSTTATTQHFRLTHRLLDAGLRYSVRSATRDIEVPALDRQGMVEQGAACYVKYCVQCHGAPGASLAAEGRGMSPISGNLAQSAREWPPEWLYYVTSKGVRMSGMPAWEYRISESGLWSTVALSESDAVQTRAAYERFAAASRERNVARARHVRSRTRSRRRKSRCVSTPAIPATSSGTWSGRTRTSALRSKIGHRRKIHRAACCRTHPTTWCAGSGDPQAISPHTLMPDLEVTEPHARTMARYLLQTHE